jgi:serine phosphatase RsbU (regulator of sigma subunit)
MKYDSALRDLPVIVISALDEMENIVKGIAMGAEDYLPKPFDPVLLKARIEASLEKKHLRDLQEAYLQHLDLENKRKSDELEKARRIQLSMLPAALPQLPHLDIAAQQTTASEVGGDYYDFFPQPDGKLLVAIGDATGHGVGSSLMVVMTKTALLAIDEADLASKLRKINTILCEINLDRQLNMALLLLELSSLHDDHITLRACGGGMPPLYILRAVGGVEEVAVRGLPLGAMDDGVYQPVEFHLQIGDVLVLMSDGLSETFNAAGEMLGFERMELALGPIDPLRLTAADVLERVGSIGNAWAGPHPLQDDVTLVVLRARCEA